MLISFAACAADTNVEAPITTTDAQVALARSVVTNDVEPISEELEALDYGGETFVILQRPVSTSNHTTSGNYQYTDELYAEELSNDPINDAIYNRNVAIEELLGVDIIMDYATGVTELQQKVRIMTGAGDSTYDLVAGSAAWGTSLILEGNVYNLYDNGIDTYLDTTKPWWPQNWINEAEIADRLYCIAGGPGLSLYRLMVVGYYNKDMAEEHGIEEDIYDVVNDGRWTVDYLSELVAGVYQDLNGNSMRDTEDEYGLAIDNYDNADIFLSGFDLRFIDKNNSGKLEFNINQKEKIVNAYEKIYALIYGNTGGTYYRFDAEPWDEYPDHIKMFTGGNALITFLHLQHTESSAFRNMQDEYGIIPTPKYDENQDNYYTYVHDQYSVFMVPITVKNPEMSGAVLETMAYESYKSLLPAYFEVALKGRYANDAESRNMIDMISENVLIDTAVIYGSMVGYAAAETIRGNIGGYDASCATTYESHSRKMPKLLKALEATIGGLEY